MNFAGKGPRERKRVRSGRLMFFNHRERSLFAVSSLKAWFMVNNNSLLILPILKVREERRVESGALYDFTQRKIAHFNSSRIVMGKILLEIAKLTTKVKLYVLRNLRNHLPRPVT